MTPTGNTSASIQVKTLDRKHSEWLLYNDMFNSIDLLYEGSVKLKNRGMDLLSRRPKELIDVYNERYRRLTYQNLIGNCVGWYLAKLFSREAQIDGKTTDERFAAFLQDCDRGGTTFADFTKARAEEMFLFRRTFILVDKPAPTGPVQTRADEKEQGLDRPYLIPYDPRQAFNWACDEYGNLNWIIFKTVEVSQGGPLDAVTQSANWWLFDRTSYRHYRYTNPSDALTDGTFFEQSSITDSKDAVATLIDEGPHALSNENEVPVIMWELPRSLWFASRAYLHLLEHFDQKNGYAWKLFMCAHPQLVIQSEKEITGKTLSEVSFLQIDPNDKIFWLEPNGASLKESRDYLNELRQEIYRDFCLQAQGRPSTATADGASGYSKEMEMAPSVDMLNGIGDVIRPSQQLTLIAYKAAAGMAAMNDTQTPDVNGYRFESKPVLQDITIAQALTETGVPDKSPTLEKLVDTNIAMAVCDGQNEAIKETIRTEIEAAPTRKEQAAIDAQAQMDQQQQQFEQQLSARLDHTDATNVVKQESDSIA